MRTTKTAVVTPTPKTFLRSLMPLWAIIGLIVLAGLLVTLLPSLDRDLRPLSPSNPGPRGAQAIVEVMRDHGVTVHEARSASDAIHWGKSGATVVVANTQAVPLDIADIIRKLPSVVYVNAGHTYDTLDGGIYSAPNTGIDTGKPVPANCSLPAARAAESISSASNGLSIKEGTAGFVGCFPASYDLFLYVEGRTSAGPRAYISDSSLIENRSVAEYGNAALAISAMSRTGRVVWYLPSWQDTLDDSRSIEPTFLHSTLVLLGGAGLVLALALGRRMGRLVPEKLPSHVPASETIVGRGRLLRRAKDYSHSARILRCHSARAIASRLGVPPGASSEELHSALIRRGFDPRLTYDLLWGPSPVTEKGLVALSDRLIELEENVKNA